MVATSCHDYTTTTTQQRPATHPQRNLRRILLTTSPSCHSERYVHSQLPLSTPGYPPPPARQYHGFMSHVIYGCESGWNVRYVSPAQRPSPDSPICRSSLPLQSLGPPDLTLTTTTVTSSAEHEGVGLHERPCHVGKGMSCYALSYIPITQRPCI